MARRELLHISKLNDFGKWLEEQGYMILPTSKNPYEVLRAKKDKDIVIIYCKASSKEHLSIMDKDYSLIRRFINESKKNVNVDRIENMTENEAVKYMKIERECINRNCDRNCAECDIVQEVDDLNSAYDVAIKALKDISWYQALGNKEECQKAFILYREMYKRKFTLEIVEEYMKFEDECLRKNFTFKSLIEAREKQTPKQPCLEGDGYADGHLVYNTWICPCCGKYYEIDYEKYDYCPNCGQAVDWSMENEDID